MHSATKTDATQILKEWSAGDKEAPVRLMPLVYEELRQRAGCRPPRDGALAIIISAKAW